jgi:hypothetical protein
MAIGALVPAMMCDPLVAAESAKFSHPEGTNRRPPRFDHSVPFM